MTAPHTDDVRITPPARLACFGAAPTAARVELLARSASWRTTRALLAAGIGVGVTPLVAIIPPHIPWAAAALIGGGVVARNRWQELYTLVHISGLCPRCGGAIDQSPGKRLASKPSVLCGHCGETVLLEVDLPQAS